MNSMQCNAYLAVGMTAVFEAASNEIDTTEQDTLQVHT